MALPSRHAGNFSSLSIGLMACLLMAGCMTQPAYRTPEVRMPAAWHAPQPHASSRQQLADAMDVNYQTIGFLERGDYSPSLKLALSLAEYFGLPVEAIFSTKPFELLSKQVYGTGVLDSLRGQLQAKRSTNENGN